MRITMLAAAVLSFLITHAAAQDATQGKRGSSFADSERAERAERFAETMVGRFDTNKNGQLERGEWTLTSFLNDQIDQDRDGVISKDEIFKRLLTTGSLTSSSRSRPANTPEQTVQLQRRESESNRGNDSPRRAPDRSAEATPKPEAASPDLPPIEGPVERLLIFARHAQATDLAKALNALFQASAEPAARIVAVPNSNSLLVTATPELLPEVTELVEQLDRAPAMIGLQVVIVERNHHEPAAVTGAPTRPSAEEAADEALKTGPAAEVLAKIERWERQGKLSVLHRLNLSTLENQAAMVQIGKRVPVVQGVNLSTRGETRNTLDRMVGMIVGVQPRVAGEEAVVVELDFEKSDVVEHPSDPPLATTSSGEKIPSTRTVTSTAKSTLTIPRGQAVVLADVRTTGANEQNRLLLVVTASVSRPAGKNGD